MTPRFQKGQKIIIAPVKSEQLSPRDSALEPYAGQVGKIADYYWIDLGRGAGVFYVYKVLMDTDQKELAVHEDELDALIE